MWNETIRTGNVDEDRRLVGLAQQRACDQGLSFQVQARADGGFDVQAAPKNAMVPVGASLATRPAHRSRRSLQQECDGCQLCGRNAPTQHVTFMRNVGVIVMRFPKTLSGSLCKRCVKKSFWEYTLITLFLGWWGVISFFYSLFAIPANIGAMLSAWSLPDEFAQDR